MGAEYLKTQQDRLYKTPAAICMLAGIYVVRGEPFKIGVFFLAFIPYKGREFSLFLTFVNSCEQHSAHLTNKN